MKWNEVPTGVSLAGMRAFLQELGDRSGDFLGRCDEDPEFARAVAQAVLGFLQHVPQQQTRKKVTMLDVKQLMGSRCFLAKEIHSLVPDMTKTEREFLPELNEAQLERLMDFLQGPCPITQSGPAHRTHVLFPMPAIIKGRDVDLQLLNDLNIISSFPYRHSNLGRTQQAKWFLLFLDQNLNPGVPGTSINVDKQTPALPPTYHVPDPELLVFGLGLWKRRGLRLIQGDGIIPTDWRTNSFTINDENEEKRLILSHANGALILFAEGGDMSRHFHHGVHKPGYPIPFAAARPVV